MFAWKNGRGGPQAGEGLVSQDPRTKGSKTWALTGGHSLRSLLLYSTSNQFLTPSTETQCLFLLFLLLVHLRQTWWPSVHEKCPCCGSTPSTKPRILWWGNGVFKEWHSFTSLKRNMELFSSYSRVQEKQHSLLESQQNRCLFYLFFLFNILLL